MSIFGDQFKDVVAYLLGWMCCLAELELRYLGWICSLLTKLK
jgi:hypothetical protein